MEVACPVAASKLTAVPIEINWHSGLPVYASAPFLKSVGDEFGWIGGMDAEGRLRCVLPYTVIRKAGIRMIRFRVETIAIDGDLQEEEEKSFLNSAVEHFRSMGADIIIPATTNTIFRTYPDGAIAAPYGSFIMDLTLPEEKLWTNLHSKHRNVIRNAMKKEVRLLTGMEHLDTAFTLVRDTFKRSNISFMSHQAFKDMVSALGENVMIFVADYQGKVQGCAVIPYSSYSAYYVYGGSAEEGVVTGAMNFLQWEAMRHFRNLGVKRYDFVGVRINPEKGSKQEGLQMFKQRFGGQLVQGYMWKYALRPLRASAYSWAVRLLRGGDIVDVERQRLAGAGEGPAHD